MRSLWFGILVCAAMFVACGDDDSDFATRPSDDSSSSVTPKSSSSSKVPEPAEKSSSSTKSSSSSEYIRVPCDVETDENCFEDARDGQTYKTVKIGDQVWMAENLNYKTDSSFCYNDSVEYCEKYGRLYTWAVAMDSAGTWSANGMGCGYNKTCSPTYPVRGVCPSGWHLPDTTEWNTLFNAVGGSSIAGTKLKFMSGWYNSGNGTDDFGFSAPPAGYRHYYGYYNYEGRGAYFWSSTEFNSNGAYYMGLYYSYDPADQNIDGKNYRFSVRCLKDYDDESSSSVTPESSDSETSVSSSSTESSSSSAKVDGSEYDAIANTLKDLRDGQTYKTVKIGDQVWMAENLNFETDSSFCYNDSVEYCEKYGRLYTWAVAMDSAGAWTTNGKDCGYGEDCSPTYPVRGVCPEGWHLPSMDEWDTLFTAAGDSSVAWTKLKSTSGWYNGGNGTDDLGFSVFPAGERFRKDGDYYYEGYNAFFWSSTEFVSYTAFYRYLHYSSDYVLLDYESKNFGFSVRCLQD
ncbi:MAG: fibrobacter succinogenes major paralogous domain-containing protein [Fibrobacter sp.]|nr:fibrobacter succinogenes major paralogous domain-containing protein [Fibrobacter sp.]